MNSQKSAQAANVTTAADEIKRFGRYLEFNTRDLRESVATFLVGPNRPSPANTFRRDAEEGLDEGLFDDDVDIPGGDWVEVTDYATEAKEDTSQQIYHRAPTPPPGPIEQTALAAQRAALQALGLTGTYLEHGLRLAAEDAGWLTHTLQFEDAVHAVQRRFPMLKKLSESYGEGARKERARRYREEVPGARLREWRGLQDSLGVAAAAAPTRGEARAYQRLSKEELEVFGAMEEA
ncbi:hypothetical protein MBLNU13_g07084t1 [Cladosporium sp. NU13]